jgi:hypothetical protein
MRVRHIYPSASSRGEVGGPTGFLVGSSSNWCSLSTERESRYEGWFIEDDRTIPRSFTKILERVTYLKGEHSDIIVDPEGVTVTGDQAFWEYGDGARLGFNAFPDIPALRLQAGRPASLALTLDIRGMYQSPDLGRSYQVREVPGGLFVQYEDHLLGQPVYVAIKTDGELCLDEWWEEVSYPWDTARHSGPEKKHVYNLAVCNATWIALGASANAEQAQQACTVASQTSFPVVGIGIAHTSDTLTQEVKAATVGAKNTLEMLMHTTGTYAGLPWFHQVWARDELIAGLGMPEAEQLSIIQKYIGTALQEGELPTFVGSGTVCADGVGWLALLIREYGLKKLTDTDQKKVTKFLRDAVKGLKEHHLSPEGLITSDHNATWMDTIGREGCRIEIQTMFGLALELLSDLTEDKSLNQERETFLSLVKQHFYQRGVLWDGAEDSTIRPNVFLAYLLQPDLLKSQEWERAFGHALSALRTTWGGLTSLDRKDKKFQDLSTGETNESYHNGDSWFFVNNLAGVALNRFGMKMFKPVVEELLRSSTEEILWKHVVGHAGEIASAKDGTSWGCGCQAFSAGAYLLFTGELGF